MPVLVLHASEHGSTVEVAERVAARLVTRGIPVDVHPFDKSPTPGAYTAVVIGSAVHDGAWLPQAADFVHRHRDALTVLPVWMFSVGMTGALRGPMRRLAEHTEQRAIVRLRALIGPRGYHRFSGVIHPDHLNRTGRVLFRLFTGRYGDYRDWTAIDAWTDSIAEALTVDTSASQ
ncbi:flavodoxin domain-containing protein [Streptomyces sp. NPDC050095]|uniref:flavodoxin domain-containing protein n=1 Tax=unclassified Streptomyces TaxID=2593676 RepID=UPI0034485737